MDDFLKHLAGIRDTDLSCNCPWLNCPVHPKKLCPKKACAYACPDHDEYTEHLLGDKSLSEDAHLCIDCARAIMDVLVDELGDVMSQIEDYIPKWMNTLNWFIGRSYQEARVDGWGAPLKDATAVSQFAFVIVQLDSGHKIPTEVLNTLIAFKTKLRELINAFHIQSEDLEEKGVPPSDIKSSSKETKHPGYKDLS